MKVTVTILGPGYEESTHMGTEEFKRIDIDTEQKTVLLFPLDPNKMHYVASFGEFARISITQEEIPDEHPTDG